MKKRETIEFLFNLEKDYVNIEDAEIIETLGYPDFSDLKSVLNWYSRVGYKIDNNRYSIENDFEIHWVDSDEVKDFFNGSFHMHGSITVHWLNPPDNYESMGDHWAIDAEYIDNKIKDITIVNMEDSTELYIVDNYKKIKWTELRGNKRFLHF